MVKRTRGAILQSIQFDPKSAQSLTTQILIAVRNLILSGGLRAGERLPSTRTLAKDLGVSRNTIVGVFDRLLAEGLLEARIGAGTFIVEIQNFEQAPNDREPKLSDFSGLNLNVQIQLKNKNFQENTLSQDPSKFAPRLGHGVRAFTTALPALDLFPVAQWSRLTSKHWRGSRDVVLGYGKRVGYLPLRQSIAAFLRVSLGIDCRDEQIFVTNGAQQAFHVIGSFLLKPNDTVWFENPGALGARNALVAARAKLQPIPVDQDGIIVKEGLRRAPDFRLAFVTPTHQQPLGVKMSLARRIELLKAAEAANAWIIEDDYDSEFHYGNHRLPSLKSLDQNDRVLYVGTFSKTLFPEVRLGYILAPESLVDSFTRIFESVLPNVSTSSQAVLSSFMDEGHFGAHLRRMRRIYSERHQVLLDCAKEHLNGLLDVRPVEAGLHTVGYLPKELSEERVAERADKYGVSVVPLRKYCIEPTDLNGLSLGFSGVNASQLLNGVMTLQKVCHELLAET